jgi:hypothetical protein
VQRKILDGLKIREHALGARHLHRAEELAVSAAETLKRACKRLTSVSFGTEHVEPSRVSTVPPVIRTPGAAVFASRDFLPQPAFTFGTTFAAGGRIKRSTCVAQVSSAWRFSGA